MKIDLNTLLGFYGRYVTRVGPMTLLRANRFHAVYQSAKNRFEKEQLAEKRKYIDGMNKATMNIFDLEEILEQKEKLLKAITGDLKC